MGAGRLAARLVAVLLLAHGFAACVPARKPVLAPEASLAEALSGMIWPVPLRDARHFTSAYGARGGRHHDGLDITAPRGTHFHAASAGNVVFSGWRGGYGNTVVVDHGRGVTTLYAHASEIFVRVGERVTRGQPIGAVGATGNATGNHVHFEIAWRGAAIDPLPLLPRLAAR